MAATEEFNNAEQFPETNTCYPCFHVRSIVNSFVKSKTTSDYSREYRSRAVVRKRDLLVPRRKKINKITSCEIPLGF